MSAPVSHDGTGFDDEDEMMQAYADESPAADFIKMTAKRTIDVGQLVTSADVEPRAAPLVKVTEVSGRYFHEPYDTEGIVGDYVVRLADLLPEGVEGRRGRFLVRVEWTEEGE